MTVSEKFVSAVAMEMERVLNSPAEISRLGLSRDIVAGWLRLFAKNTPQSMIAEIKDVAQSNKIPLEDEPQHPKEAAELFLSTIDGLFRRSVAPREASDADRQ